jgi:hypothetical protein
LVVHDGIEDKRDLLADAIQHYFGATCPALVARCEVAIIRLPPLALQEVAGCLQTLVAFANETSRELAVASVEVARGQAPTELLRARALASIEHLSEVVQAMTLWMDKLLKMQSPQFAEKLRRIHGP